MKRGREEGESERVGKEGGGKEEEGKGGREGQKGGGREEKGGSMGKGVN